MRFAHCALRAHKSSRSRRLARNGSAAEMSARAPSRERPSKTASKSPLSADATHDANALASKAPPAPKTSAAATH
jgi:hypothetical protein